MSATGDSTVELSRWRARADRERRARLAAEAQAEQGLRQLYEQQRQLKLLHVTAAAANAASSPEQALKVALDEFCAYTGWPVGHALMTTSQRAGALTPTTIWHLEKDESFQNFRDISQSICFPAGGGLPGRVVVEQIPVWVEDLSEDTNFPRREAALAAGLRCAIAFPILTKTEVVAVLEFFARERLPINTGLIALAAQMGTLLGRLFEREQAQEALRRAGVELEERVRARTAELATANERLARAARLKDEFLAAMSHELRTPLNTILGVTETLQEGIFGAMNERQLQALQMTGESSHHLLSLINDILDVSKIEAGKLTLEIEPVTVELICQAAVRLVKPGAVKKQLSVELQVEGGIGEVLADQRRLKQMLVNLLSNAVKFTPDGGRIGLDVRRDPAGSCLLLTVWDTGIGISEEDQARLFQPFQQLDSRLSRSYNGTGLGLTLVSRMAGLHGGQVRLQSVVGQGSRFTIVLPWADPGGPSVEPAATEFVGRAEMAAPLASTPPRSRRPAILVTDDHAVNRSLLAIYLAKKGYTVLEAESGEQAVAIAARERPSLILMDGQMPGMDGFEATRRIKALPECAAIPIIALTAMAMAGDRERFLAAGYCDYLSKPVSFAAVGDAIQKQLGADLSATEGGPDKIAVSP